MKIVVLGPSEHLPSGGFRVRRVFRFRVLPYATTTCFLFVKFLSDTQ